MRLVATVALVWFVHATAAAQRPSNPFLTGGYQPQRSTPPISADFGMSAPTTARPRPLAQPLVPLAPAAKSRPAADAAPAIDCRMVRRPDASIDPHLARQPSTDVVLPMKVVTAAGCPAR